MSLRRLQVARLAVDAQLVGCGGGATCRESVGAGCFVGDVFGEYFRRALDGRGGGREGSLPCCAFRLVVLPAPWACGGPAHDVDASGERHWARRCTLLGIAGRGIARRGSHHGPQWQRCCAAVWHAAPGMPPLRRQIAVAAEVVNRAGHSRSPEEVAELAGTEVGKATPAAWAARGADTAAGLLPGARPRRRP